MTLFMNFIFIPLIVSSLWEHPQGHLKTMWHGLWAQCIWAMWEKQSLRHGNQSDVLTIASIVDTIVTKPLNSTTPAIKQKCQNHIQRKRQMFSTTKQYKRHWHHGNVCHYITKGEGVYETRSLYELWRSAFNRESGNGGWVCVSMCGRWDEHISYM